MKLRKVSTDIVRHYTFSDSLNMIFFLRLNSNQKAHFCQKYILIREEDNVCGKSFSIENGEFILYGKDAEKCGDSPFLNEILLVLSHYHLNNDQ